MAFKTENFKFSADILKGSAGNFKALLKERYELSETETSQLVKKFYGKDPILQEDGDTPTVPKKSRKAQQQGKA